MVDSHEMGSHDTYLFSPPRHAVQPVPAGDATTSGPTVSPRTRPARSTGAATPTTRASGTRSSSPATARPGPVPRRGRHPLRDVGHRGHAGQAIAPHACAPSRQAVEHQATSSDGQPGHAGRQPSGDPGRSRRRPPRRRSPAPAPATASLRPGCSRAVPDPRRTDRLVESAARPGDRGAARLFRAGRRRAVCATPAPARRSTAAELAGDYWVVPLDQPAAPLARNLLDPHLPMNAEFLREEREYQERGKGTRLYETTAWSLLLAYDVDAYWTDDRPKQARRHGAPVEQPQGSFEADPAAVAFVMPGGADRSLAGVGRPAAARNPGARGGEAVPGRRTRVTRPPLW